MFEKTVHAILRGGWLILFLWVSCAQMYAQVSNRPWTLEVGLAISYDNNILKYSDKYIGRFTNSEDPGRFHIKSIDDAILRPSLRVERDFDLFPRLSTTLGGEINQRVYLRNSIKNWMNIRFLVKQMLPERTSIQMMYSWTPEFYVRHYRDEDWVDLYGYTPATFHQYDFTKEDVGGLIQHTLWTNTRLAVSFSRARYFYNSHFTEYDSRNSVWGVEVSHPVLKNLRVSAGYQFTSSDATGIDQPGESKNVADDSDGSFDEDDYSAGITLKLNEPFGLPSSISVDGEYSRRVFTSTHYLDLDPLHAGRIDHDYGLQLRYAVQLSQFTVAASYEWRYRDAETTAVVNEPYVSNEKDYRNYLIGLGVTYEIRF